MTTEVLLQRKTASGTRGKLQHNSSEKTGSGGRGGERKKEAPKAAKEFLPGLSPRLSATQSDRSKGRVGARACSGLLHRP